MATDRTRGWWEEYRELLPTPFLDLAELEHHATFLREVQFLFVPGPLQTEDYARAVFSYRFPSCPPKTSNCGYATGCSARQLSQGPRTR